MIASLPANQVLSVIPANSITPAVNVEPYPFSTTYAGLPCDYWILRGRYDSALAELSNGEFIFLRAWRDTQAALAAGDIASADVPDEYAEPFPDNWEAISTLIINQRAQAEADLQAQLTEA